MTRVTVRLMLSTEKVVVMAIPNNDSYEETMEALVNCMSCGEVFAIGNYKGVTARFGGVSLDFINMAHVAAIGVV